MSGSSVTQNATQLKLCDPVPEERIGSQSWCYVHHGNVGIGRRDYHGFHVFGIVHVDTEPPGVRVSNCNRLIDDWHDYHRIGIAFQKIRHYDARHCGPHCGAHVGIGVRKHLQRHLLGE